MQNLLGEGAPSSPERQTAMTVTPYKAKQKARRLSLMGFLFGWRDLAAEACTFRELRVWV